MLNGRQGKRITRALIRTRKSLLQTMHGPVESPIRLASYVGMQRETGGPLQDIDVRSNLSRDEFVSQYLSKNRPVVITDAVDRWHARHWTLESFERDFGHNTVNWQSPEFEGSNTCTLADFIAEMRRYENMPLDELPVPNGLPYARNAMVTDGECFTTTAFERLGCDWERPYFMPIGGYVWPPRPLCSLPNIERHPLFGFFISPRGAATALHADARLSNALLAQFVGEKKIFLFTPDQTQHLPRLKARPAAHLLRGETPDFGGQRPIEITLKPGMMIFIPKYHWHEVYTLSSSISLTYNFVHASDISLQWMRDAKRFEADPTAYAGQ